MQDNNQNLLTDKHLGSLAGGRIHHDGTWKEYFRKEKKKKMYLTSNSK